MRARWSIPGLMLLLASFGQPLRAQLTGTWRLDNARSTGAAPNLRAEMTIAQTGEQLIIERRFRLPQGPVVLGDTLAISGTNLPYTFRAPNGQEGRGVRTSRPLGGTGVEIADSVLVDTPIGPAPRWTTQKWTVDPAGETLTQEVTLRQPFVVTPLKNVWVREKS